MSSQEFDTLRAKYPTDYQLVSELESILVRHLRQDPEAVVDDDIVVQELRSVPQLAEIPRERQRELAHRLLLELVSLEALKTVFLWICANGLGTTREAEDITSFPSVVFCERCGEEHFFSDEEIEVHFLPTAELRDHLLEGT